MSALFISYEEEQLILDGYNTSHVLVNDTKKKLEYTMLLRLSSIGIFRKPVHHIKGIFNGYAFYLSKPDKILAKQIAKNRGINLKRDKTLFTYLD